MSQRHRTVLVVGSSGFLGRRLARSLLGDGRTVRCMARDPTTIQELANAGCEVVRGDMLDPASIGEAVQGIDAVYICVHTLSPQASAPAGQTFMDVEETGMRNIIAACETHGVRRLVYVTSIGVAAASPSAWLRGRWRIEHLLFASGLDVSVIRPGMIVGRGGQGFEAVLRGARNRIAFGLGGGRQRMRTIAVDDLTYYLTGVLDDPRSYGKGYDVGSDDVLTTDEMTDIAAECLDRQHPRKLHVPSRLLGALAPLIERMSKMPAGAMSGLVDSLAVDMVGDPAPIRTLLTRAPQAYREAVKRTLGDVA